MLDEMFQHKALKFVMHFEYLDRFILFFISSYLVWFLFPKKFPSLCRHRPGHSLGNKNQTTGNMNWEMKKPAIQKESLLKRFSGYLHQSKNFYYFRRIFKKSIRVLFARVNSEKYSKSLGELNTRYHGHFF